VHCSVDDNIEKPEVQGRYGKNNDMSMIYLSPHLDDVILSLGGLIWEQIQAGLDVCILTVCAGDPPEGEFSPFAESLHTRWEVGREAMADRRAEDIVSCQRLGASFHHLDVPDCIYRRSDRTGQHLYDSEEALWFPVHPDETPLIEVIRKAILDIRSFNDTLICPLALGDHVDHRLTRTAAENTRLPLRYYADYPYVLKLDVRRKTTDMDAAIYSITPAGISAWQDAVAAHRSQISTFWGNLDEMRAAIQSYYDGMGGIWLWH
jgi:LmbE family N-acetylglucosaminyl deacetylase